MATNKRVTTIAIVAVILILMGISIWFATNAMSGRSGSGEKSDLASPQASGGATIVAPATGQRPIRVGILVSLRTSIAVGPNGPRGFDKQTRIARDLHAPDIEVYPIVDAGTENSPTVAEQLLRLFAGRQPINGADPAALKTLDVIATGENWDANDDVMAAIESAVSDGVGLLNNGGLGSDSPGTGTDHPVTSHLAGLVGAHFGITGGPVDCQVIADHPILGKSFGQPGEAGTLKLRAMGVYGTMPPDAVPLLKVSDMTSFQRPGSDSSEIFYLLYTSQLGKGKIIGCQFAAYAGVPASLQGPGRSQFYQRCVRWLAGRAVE